MAGEWTLSAQPEQALRAVDPFDDVGTVTIDDSQPGQYRILLSPQEVVTGNFSVGFSLEVLERLAESGECEVGILLELDNEQWVKWSYNARGKVIFDVRGGIEEEQREGWVTELPARLGITRLNNACFLEWNGRVHDFYGLDGAAVRNVWVEIENRTGKGMHAELTDLSFEVIEPEYTGEIQLERPFKKSIFMCVLGWYPTDRFSSSYATDLYDFPILPVDEGTLGQVNSIGEHGIDAVQVDFLGAKRPSMVASQFNLSDDWMEAIRQSDYPDMTFAPFWEYDSGGADPYHKSAGVGSSNLADAAAFVADVLAYHNLRYRDDPELYRLQGYPVDYLYNSMIYNEPEFWMDVRENMRDTLGYAPIFSLGPGGLPMTLYAEFEPEYFHRYTDTAFDSIFVFNLWGPTADQFPAKIIDHYRDDPVQVVGTAVPGYWSVRHNHRTIVHARYTERLREVLAASLAADVDGIYVTTWNDYRENTQFSPSFSYLDSRMEILQTMAAPWLGKSAALESHMPRAILTYRKVAYPGEPFDCELLLLPTKGFSGEVSVRLSLRDSQGKLIHKSTLSGTMGDELTALRLSDTTNPVAIPGPGPDAVSVEVLLVHGGQEYPVSHLPQIAVLPLDYLDPDLLNYSVPLHKMASGDKSPGLIINEEVGPIVPTDGIVSYVLDAPEDVQFALMRNSRAARMMAPLEMGGAEFYPGRPSTVTLEPRKYPNFVDASSDQGRRANVPEIQNPKNAVSHFPMNTGGYNYFAALVEYPDGRFAYTPLVWISQQKPDAALVGSYVFNEIDKGYLRDRSPMLRHIAVGEEAAKDFSRVFLRPELPVLHWDAQSPTLGVPIDFLPPGAASLECVFRFEQTGRPQALLYQPHYSRQLELELDATGCLLLTRQNNSGQEATVRTEPLEAGRVYQAVAVFTGSEIQLYLDGELAGASPCVGVRTGEGTWIGGKGEERFQGEIVRMNVFTGALSENQVEDMYYRFEQLELNP